MAEKLNITEHYDRIADVLYIDFGFDEPCYTEPIDGVVMVDIGWFSKLPRGLRVMSPRAHKFECQMVIRQAEQVCRKAMEQQVKQIQTEEPILHDILGQTLTQAFSHMPH
jgi:hypothetical protein